MVLTINHRHKVKQWRKKTQKISKHNKNGCSKNTKQQNIFRRKLGYDRCHTEPFMTLSQAWYGIVEFNVPVDTV